MNAADLAVAVTAASDGDVRLKCLIQPRASRCAIVGIHDGQLKVALAAPPVDGEANKALTEFFAKLLKVGKSKVTLCSGQTSRRKVLAFRGIGLDELMAIVAAAANQ